MLQSMGSQRLGHNLAAEQQQMSSILKTLSGKSQKMETIRKNKKEMLGKNSNRNKDCLGCHQWTQHGHGKASVNLKVYQYEFQKLTHK